LNKPLITVNSLGIKGDFFCTGFLLFRFAPLFGVFFSEPISKVLALDHC